MVTEAQTRLQSQEQAIQDLKLKVAQGKDINQNLKKQQEYFIEQIADLKKELCGMESQSNLIVFSSKHSTVSPSENDTSTVQSQNEEDDCEEAAQGSNDESIAHDANMLIMADRGVVGEGNNTCQTTLGTIVEGSQNDRRGGVPMADV